MPLNLPFVAGSTDDSVQYEIFRQIAIQALKGGDIAVAAPLSRTTGISGYPITIGLYPGALTGQTGGTSGTFTAGSVIFAGPGGYFSQDNANFFYDSTLKQLQPKGLPSATGASQLRVSAAGAGSISALVYAQNNAAIGLGVDFAGGQWIARDANAYQIYQLGAALNFNADTGLTPGVAYTPTTRMTLTSAGNVGIATADAYLPATIEGGTGSGVHQTLALNSKNPYGAGTSTSAALVFTRTPAAYGSAVAMSQIAGGTENDTTSNQGFLAFYTKDAVGSLNQNLTIDYFGDTWLAERTATAQTAKVGGTLFTQTADGTVSNTVTETSLWGTGSGSRTLPANLLIAGRTLQVQMRGTAVETAGANFTVKVKYGSTLLATSGTLIPGTSVNAYVIDLFITCRTTGGSGTVVLEGFHQVNNATQWLEGPISSNGAVTIDTTTANALDVTVTWSAASASNTVLSRIGVLEVLN